MAFQPTAMTHEREARSRGEAFAVATVVRAERPTSCRPGDKAVIRSDGRLQGWIGGSCAQPTVISEALASLADGEPRLVLLTPDGIARPRTGMTVHQMSCFSGGVVEVFIEPFLPAPQLIICGVSPAAVAIASIGHVVGFEVVVVDALATPEDFPTASVVVGRIDPSSYPASRERYAIVATHGLWDEEALRQVLAVETSYVGLVASVRRFDATIADLAMSGGDPDQLGRVECRPGLEIGARTFQEVALGIVADLVARRRGAQGHGAEQHVRVPDLAEIPVLHEDPICGMMVDPEATPHRLEHAGHVWYYCAPRCRRMHARQLGVNVADTVGQSSSARA
ncbi:MAG: XdhC family protein [Chloroflexi bacterium]|nr:XdhC family protein [Chloroflexota bacterium]